MKVNKKDVLYWVIPVFSVVVIFQSVILVKNTLNRPVVEKKEATSTATSNVVKGEMKTDLDLSITTADKEWKVGKTYQVSLEMFANTVKQIDAMDLFVKYDKDSFKVSKIVQGEGLPKPVTDKVGEKGLVVANLYIPGSESYSINKLERKVLLTFDVMPTKAGEYKFEFDTGKVAKDSVTMIVETKTAKVIPFSAGILTINVVK